MKKVVVVGSQWGDDGKGKIPHIGFNSVNPPSSSRMFYSVDKTDFYFVHSYCVKEAGSESSLTYCQYNSNFVAAIEKDHIWGTQFHPEKSQASGLQFLKNNYQCNL